MFHVRGGRVRGQRGWVIDKVEGATDTPALVERFLTQFYGEQAALAESADDARQPVPREVLVPELPADADALAEWLSELRGSRVRLRVPQRGDKRALTETVERNAKEAFTQHKLRRAGDLTARSAALPEIQDALGLDEAPLRIECVDVSPRAGQQRRGLAGGVRGRAGAQVGLPPLRGPRTAPSGGDVAAIAEVTRRRFRRYLDRTATATLRTGVRRRERARADRWRIDPAADVPPARPGIDPTPAGRASSPTRRTCRSSTAAPRRSRRPRTVLAELGVTDVAVCGLAKRLEEVWLPGDPDPVILPRTSEGLYLLQRVRDEAHRFAITYHRQKRSKADDGVGARRRTRSRPDTAQGAAQAVRFGAQAARRRRRRDRRRARHRAGGRPSRCWPRCTPRAGVDRPTRQPVDRGRPTARRSRRRMTEQPEPAAPSQQPHGIEVALVSGLSGAGRSTAAKGLEDLGWFVVDNLPPELISTMVELGARAQGDITRIAVVMDVRSRAFSADLRCGDQGPRRPRLQAPAAVPRGRRRRARPPLRAGAAQPPAAGRRAAGRRHRRRARRCSRRCASAADLVIDTSDALRADLRGTLERDVRRATSPRRCGSRVLSFGFKYGLPMDADLVVDVRFLPNPHWIPELREHTGRDPAVRDYVLSQDGAERVPRPLPGAAARWSAPATGARASAT